MPRKNDAQQNATVVPTRPSSRPGRNSSARAWSSGEGPSAASQSGALAPTSTDTSAAAGTSTPSACQTHAPHRRSSPAPWCCATNVCTPDAVPMKIENSVQVQMCAKPTAASSVGAEPADHGGVHHAHQRGRHLRDDHRPGEAGDFAQATACRGGRGEGVGSGGGGHERAPDREALRGARCGPPGWWSWLQLRSRRARPNRRFPPKGRGSSTAVQILMRAPPSMNARLFTTARAALSPRATRPARASAPRAPGRPGCRGRRRTAPRPARRAGAPRRGSSRATRRCRRTRLR